MQCYGRHMRKYLAALLVFSVGGALPAMGSHADDEIPSPKPVELMRRQQDPAITRGQTMVWDLDAPGAVSAYVAFSNSASSQNAPEPQVLCSGPDDPVCPASTYSTLNSSIVLGTCESDAELGCIEGLSQRDSSGAMTPLTKVSGGDTVTAEHLRLGIPRGATLSTWEDSTGARYVLTAHLSAGLFSQGGAWVAPKSSTFLVMLSRIPRGTTHPAGSISIIDSPAMPGRKTTATANGSPWTTVELTKGMRFNLKVRVPNIVSGWYQGRMANAVVGSRPLSGSRTVYEIEGDVVPVYVAGAQADASHPQFPATPNMVYNSVISSLSSPSVISDYDRWKPFMGDKALTTRNEWVLTSLGSASGSCFDAAGGLTGVASTNAAFYSPTPPAYNSSTGSLDYKVASLHHDENGQVASGSYSISMPLAAVQCLYKTTEEPTVAEIAFKYGTTTDDKAVTQSVTAKDGWVNVSVDGMHYSAPTISAKFGLRSGSGLVSLPSASKTVTRVAVKTRGSKATVTVTLTKKQRIKIYRKVGKRLTLLRTVSAKKGRNVVTTSYKKGWSFVVKDSKGKTIK